MAALSLLSLQSSAPRLLCPLLVLLVALLVVANPQGSVAGSDSPPAVAQVPADEGVSASAVLHQASISYRVSHPLASFEAVLEGAHVESEIYFDANQPKQTSGTVIVDLLGFSSRNKARDRHARRSLDTGSYPTARLELTGLQGIAREESPGANISRLRGSCRAELLLHGQRSDWSVEVELEWSDDELVVVSSFTVLLDDFSIPRDKLFGMPIRNEVPVSVELRYQRR